MCGIHWQRVASGEVVIPRCAVVAVLSSVVVLAVTPACVILTCNFRELGIAVASDASVHGIS